MVVRDFSLFILLYVCVCLNPRRKRNEWVHEIRKQKEKKILEINLEVTDGGVAADACRSIFAFRFVFVCFFLSCHNFIYIVVMRSMLSAFVFLFWFVCLPFSFWVCSSNLVVTRVAEIAQHVRVKERKKERERQTDREWENGRWFVCRLNNEDRLNYRNEL